MIVYPVEQIPDKGNVHIKKSHMLKNSFIGLKH